MKRKDSDIMVSICCITFNHEKYIAQAIEGFLMQITDFKFEILIGEDCSTDNTRQVIEKYASANPSIKLITSQQNVGAFQNSKHLIDNAVGKYVAYCDGDDYWTDNRKLQKQVDFLEKNSDYVVCCHYCEEIDSDGNLVYRSDTIRPLEYRYGDLILNKQAETSSASILTHRKLISELYKQQWLPSCNATDKFFKLFATYKTGNKVYVLPEVMSCYRRHPGGVWSALMHETLREKQLSDFKVIVQYFNHSLVQKLNLQWFYFRRYFRFDYRTSKITGVLSSVRSIW